MTQRQETIIKLRGDGLSYAEIEKRTGYDQHNVRKTCIKLGIEYTDIEQSTTGKQSETVRQTLKARGLEYIGGYENNRSHITVKAECGHKFDVAWLTIVDSRKSPQCPVCRRIKAANRKRDKQLKRMEREAYHGVQISFDSCPVCGVMVIGGKYCSKKCRDKAHNTSNWTRRKRLLNKTVVDDDITLEALYRRDKGVCHLCGGLCDYKDAETREGTVIVGNTYPTIDHVYPLSLGGTHTWDNVKLAHRICNSRKGNTPPW